MKATLIIMYIVFGLLLLGLTMKAGFNLGVESENKRCAKVCFSHIFGQRSGDITYKQIAFSSVKALCDAFPTYYVERIDKEKEQTVIDFRNGVDKE